MTSEIKNNRAILIRGMQPNDLKTVWELEKKIFPDPWSLSSFKELLDENGWGGFIAEDGSEIIGYACYYISVHEAHLTNIAIREDYRRKSVAKLLLDNILSIVSGKNCEFILLEVRPSNKSAIAFYGKHGFKILYKRPDYYHNPVEDALVMVRYL